MNFDVSEILQVGRDLPLLAAFLLGLLVAVNPCTVATNVTAVMFFYDKGQKDGSFYLKGLLYTLGRSLSYTFLGLAFWIFAGGAEVWQWIHECFGKIVGPLFLLVGFLMLDIVHVHGLADRCFRFVSMSGLSKKRWSPFVFGVVLAFAFCPYSGILYFGMMVPLSFSTELGAAVPLAFAIGAAVPVLLLVAGVAFGMERLNRLYARFKNCEKMLKMIVALLFMILGVFFIVEFYFEHGH